MEAVICIIVGLLVFAGIYYQHWKTDRAIRRIKDRNRSIAASKRARKACMEALKLRQAEADKKATFRKKMRRIV